MAQKVKKEVVKQAKIGNNWMLLLLALTFVSPVLLAQKPMVALTADDKNVSIGELVTITVTYNIEGSVKVDFPTEFEVDMNIMHGMNQKMDPSGRLVSYFFMQQSGAFQKEGNYSFYAYITYKGNKYKSNKITIKVSDSDDDELTKIKSDDPVFGVIQAKKTTVYEGEPVLVKAKVFSRFPIENLEGYAPFKPDKNAEEHVFPNQREYVEETRINGKYAQMFDYGKQLLIPVATGKCKIQPFEMALTCQGSIFSRTIRFRSTGLVLTVKPLPNGAPKQFIGGVGTFDLTQELDATKSLKQGDVFTLKLTVKGLGNLHNINAPILDLPAGCSVYGDPERAEDVQFTEDGVTGEITFLYNIQVTKEGTIQFEAPSIAFFDPIKEKYIIQRGEAFELEVKADKNFQPLTTNITPTKGHTDQIATGATKPQKSTKTDDTFNWVIGVGTPVGALSLLFLFLFLRKKKQVKPTEETNILTTPNRLSCATTPLLAEKVDYWKEAAASLEDSNQFAVYLPKAIIQKLEAKWCFTCASREKAFEKIQENQPEIAQRLRAIIDECDLFRYGFGANTIDTTALFEEANSLIHSLN